MSIMINIKTNLTNVRGPYRPYQCYGLCHFPMIKPVIDNRWSNLFYKGLTHIRNVSCLRGLAHLLYSLQKLTLNKILLVVELMLRVALDHTTCHRTVYYHELMLSQDQIELQWICDGKANSQEALCKMFKGTVCFINNN